MTRGLSIVGSMLLMLISLNAVSYQGIASEEAIADKGLALYNQGRYDEAIKAYNEAIRLDPEDAEAWFGKGSALDSLGKYDEAIKAYDEAIRLILNWPRHGTTKAMLLIAWASMMRP